MKWLSHYIRVMLDVLLGFFYFEDYTEEWHGNHQEIVLVLLNFKKSLLWVFFLTALVTCI